MIRVQDIKKFSHESQTDLPNDELCQRFVRDSREVHKGDVFVAIKGENFDGHAFVEKALQSGAKLAIVTSFQGDGQNQILVQDSLSFLADLARFYRSQFKGTVIGITGSSGKTTVKNLMSHVLSQKLKAEKTPHNYNNEIGVPFSILHFDLKADVWIVEMGMRGLGQIQYLCEIAQPNWGVITSIGTAHIEVVDGGEAGIVKAKGELFQALPKDGYAFANLDSQKIMSIKHQAQVVTYAKTEHADYQMLNFEQEDHGIEFEVQSQGSKVSVTMPVYGQHMALNSLMVFAVAHKLGLSPDVIAKSLAEFKMLDNRGGITTVHNWIVVDDTYNANYDSTKVAIESFICLHPELPHVAVLGDMLELGEYSNEFHTKIGEHLKRVGVNQVYLVGEFAHKTLEGFQNPEHGFVFEGHEQIAHAIQQNYKDQKAVFLFKGSRSTQMEKVIELLR